jgi:hypothetical protein
MSRGNRISNAIQAATQHERKIGGNIEAGHIGARSSGSGRIGGLTGESVGGGNIASASGVTVADGRQAMHRAGAGPAPDKRRIARHQPKAASASEPTSYPKGWLLTTRTGQVV